LAGSYKVDGVNPDGSKYSGTLEVTVENGVHRFKWLIGNQTYVGTGTFQDGRISVDYGDKYPAIYTRAPDGTLNGTWSNGNARETAAMIRSAQSKSMELCERFEKQFKGWHASVGPGSKGSYYLRLSATPTMRSYRDSKADWLMEEWSISYEYRTKTWDMWISLPYKFHLPGREIEFMPEDSDVDCIAVNGTCTEAALELRLNVDNGTQGEEVTHTLEPKYLGFEIGDLLVEGLPDSHRWIQSLFEGKEYEVTLIDVDGALTGEAGGALVSYKIGLDGIADARDAMHPLGEEQRLKLDSLLKQRFDSWDAEIELAPKKGNYNLTLSTRQKALISKNATATSFLNQLWLQYDRSTDSWSAAVSMPRSLKYPERDIGLSQGKECTKVNGNCIEPQLQLMWGVKTDGAENVAAIGPADFSFRTLSIWMKPQGGAAKLVRSLEDGKEFLIYLEDVDGSLSGQPKSFVAGVAGKLDGFAAGLQTMREVASSLMQKQGKSCPVPE
jgi:hypothetical protein